MHSVACHNSEVLIRFSIWRIASRPGTTRPRAIGQRFPLRSPSLSVRSACSSALPSLVTLSYERGFPTSSGSPESDGTAPGPVCMRGDQGGTRSTPAASRCRATVRLTWPRDEGIQTRAQDEPDAGRGHPDPGTTEPQHGTACRFRPGCPAHTPQRRSGWFQVAACGAAARFPQRRR